MVEPKSIKSDAPLLANILVIMRIDEGEEL